MDTPKILATISVALSGIAILACILVVPTIYQQINSLHDDIMLDVIDFRQSTDGAWNTMITMQRGGGASQKQQSELFSFGEMFRKKRQAGGQCNCNAQNSC